MQLSIRKDREMESVKSRLTNELRNIRDRTWSILKGLIATIIAVVLLASLGGLTPYKIYLLASVRKVVSNIAVMLSPPNLALFSQYPAEYGLENPRGLIKDGERLEIVGDTKPLWLGIWNEEPITIRGVRLILVPPKGVEEQDSESWGKMWLKAQFLREPGYSYQCKEYGTIISDTGWVISAPIIFKFPHPGEYRFEYAILAEDWGPIKGRKFVIVRTR